MGFVWGVLAVVAAFLWIITLFDLFKRHLGAGATAGWAIITLVFPFVGVVAYWALRKTPEEEVQRRLDLDAEIRRGAPPPRIGG